MDETNEHLPKWAKTIIELKAEALRRIAMEEKESKVKKDNPRRRFDD
jgi:hypothetical protein